MFPYVEPTVQLPDKIETTQKAIDDDYADLLNKIYGVKTRARKNTTSHRGCVRSVSIYTNA